MPTIQVLPHPLHGVTRWPPALGDENPSDAPVYFMPGTTPLCLNHFPPSTFHPYHLILPPTHHLSPVLYSVHLTHLWQWFSNNFQLLHCKSMYAVLNNFTACHVAYRIGSEFYNLKHICLPFTLSPGEHNGTYF